jgi:Polysaccharide lyase
MRRGLAVVLAPLGAFLALCGDRAAPEAPPELPKPGAVLFLDDGGPPGAKVVWGTVDCASKARVRTAAGGGDPALRGDGTAQSSPGFRRLRVLDGDDYFGERCELGENWRPTTPMPQYTDGARELTYFSLKLAKNFPIERPTWQSVMQMKQSQPFDAFDDRPALTLQVYDGRWRLRTGLRPVSDSQVWSVPAATGRWVRFAFDVTYSADPDVGSVRVAVDLNGDGDFRDRREVSGLLRMATLKREGPGTSEDGLEDGDAIPSHLRLGVYHDSAYRCHGSRCSIGVDNVGIYAVP